MEKSAVTLIGMVVLAIAAAAAFAWYRREQRRRVSGVEKGVRDYLLARYGELPNYLSINCSDDRLWPVLVAFNNPRSGIRHRLQFACSGDLSTLSLVSEKEGEG